MNINGKKFSKRNQQKIYDLSIKLKKKKTKCKL